MDSRSAALPAMSTRVSVSTLCRPARISGEAATIKTRITRLFGPFRRSEFPAARSHAVLVSSRRGGIRDAAGEYLLHLSPWHDRGVIEKIFLQSQARCPRS